MKKMTVKEIVSAVEDLLPGYAWNTNEGGTDFHLAFTGGEPLMKKNQKMILEVMKEFSFAAPRFVTFETNGTQALIPDLADYMRETSYDPSRYGTEYFFSVSPKLWSVAGEPASKAIKPDVLSLYRSVSKKGQLKFVSDGSDRSFEEIKNVCDELDSYSVYSRWVMPVGATLEEQEANAGDIAMDAVERGYNVSARVHCYLFGNQIGT
jgi:organic radical activating enzyme